MFLGDLARTKAQYPFALFGYCLMSNHFHLLLKPAPGQSISRILQSLTVAHTWRHHRRQGTSGHVWQGRFRSPVIQDGDHLLVVLRYIEANPVRAAMVADPCESTWSSHRCHGAGHADPILDSFPEWEQVGRTEPERRARWRRKVRGEQPAKEWDGVRSSVRCSGSERFRICFKRLRRVKRLRGVKPCFRFTVGLTLAKLRAWLDSCGSNFPVRSTT